MKFFTPQELDCLEAAPDSASLVLEARFEPTSENVQKWNDGSAPLDWIRFLNADGSSRPATRDDVDQCSQFWRAHGPGWFICAD